MSPAETLRELDRTIRERSILEHPFYRAWTRGALTREQIATYARVYYPHVEAFPTYLEAALAHDCEPWIRAELADNLADELGHPAPHDSLWLDFAQGVGASREEVSAATPHRAADAIVSTFEGLARSSLATGLAALYAYEAQQPEVSRTKAEGLRAHYGVSDPEALAYFRVHEQADQRHRQGERDALAACLAAGVAPQVVHVAASRALESYWGLLDGVCGEIGVSCP